MAEDFRNISQQLTKRKPDRLESLFQDDSNKEVLAHILSSPNDLGVCRNGGRRGTSFGPQAIINCLKKMATHACKNNINKVHKITNVCDNKLCDNFYEFQKDSISKIKKAINPSDI